MATIEINPLEIVQGLENTCWQCNPDGGLSPIYTRANVRRWIGDDSNPDVCGICHGKGYTLTDAGRAMLAFLERWNHV